MSFYCAFCLVRTGYIVPFITTYILSPSLAAEKTCKPTSDS